MLAMIETLDSQKESKEAQRGRNAFEQTAKGESLSWSGKGIRRIRIWPNAKTAFECSL